MAANVLRRLRRCWVAIHHNSESSRRHTARCGQKRSTLVPQSSSLARQRRQERRRHRHINNAAGKSSQTMVSSRGQNARCAVAVYDPAVTQRSPWVAARNRRSSSGRSVSLRATQFGSQLMASRSTKSARSAAARRDANVVLPEQLMPTM